MRDLPIGTARRDHDGLAENIKRMRTANQYVKMERCVRHKRHGGRVSLRLHCCAESQQDVCLTDKPVAEAIKMSEKVGWRYELHRVRSSVSPP